MLSWRQTFRFPLIHLHDCFILRVQTLPEKKYSQIHDLSATLIVWWIYLPLVHRLENQTINTQWNYVFLILIVKLPSLFQLSIEQKYAFLLY